MFSFTYEYEYTGTWYNRYVVYSLVYSVLCTTGTAPEQAWAEYGSTQENKRGHARVSPNTQTCGFAHICFFNLQSTESTIHVGQQLSTSSVSLHVASKCSSMGDGIGEVSKQRAVHDHPLSVSRRKPTHYNTTMTCGAMHFPRKDVYKGLPQWRAGKSTTQQAWLSWLRGMRAL